MNHLAYMQRCLALAKKGIADAAPNPSVGAVLVHEGKIIGEGYTSPYGGPHGEVNCINDALRHYTKIPSSSTLYVSLEPCSHFGKTPPCSDLIIKQNIEKVVVACCDPNPKVAGKGIRKLKESGIQVLEGVGEMEALELNKRFFTFHLKKRPFITLKWAQTQTGFFAPIVHEQFWITNPKTKGLVHSWRSKEMSILVGERTIHVDNPKLNNRLLAGKSPVRIIINTDKPIPAHSEVLQDKLATIVFSFKDIEDQENKKFIALNPQQPVIEQVIQTLYKENIHSVFIEGGAYTLSQFIKLGLWDEAKILIGNKELEDGIKAPLIKGELLEQYDLLGDQVKIYKNNL